MVTVAVLLSMKPSFGLEGEAVRTGSQTPACRVTCAPLTVDSEPCDGALHDGEGERLVLRSFADSAMLFC